MQGRVHEQANKQLLAYFYETQNILCILIDHYTAACEKQQNLEALARI